MERSPARQVAASTAAPHAGDAFARRVAARVQALYPSCPQGAVHAALLWPRVREGALAIGDLEAGGASARTTHTVAALIQGPHESLEDCLHRVRGDPWATMVAHAEIIEAGSPERLAQLPADAQVQERARVAAVRVRLGLDE